MGEEIERTGSCLCGTVRLTFKTANTSVSVCHCNMCQKCMGGPMLAIHCGADVQFQGSDSIMVYSSSDWAERGFCRKCGSHLFYRMKGSGEYAVPVGVLENKEQLVLKQQIFIDEKPAFYSFANDTENLTAAETIARYAADLQ